MEHKRCDNILADMTCHTP